MTSPECKGDANGPSNEQTNMRHTPGIGDGSKVGLFAFTTDTLSSQISGNCQAQSPGYRLLPHGITTKAHVTWPC
ncbi:unnamed protein product [Protopolystoma xenopodis]|uniref:Uncharacterized protein n=1 Tax=Protopolystoma xenopodis TaxID=117903 RepID=A0A3S5CGT7_9PLAT|nr:unnamed protein product [Protopolystoma xenopodis]